MKISLPLPANNLPSSVLFRSGYMPTFGKPISIQLKSYLTGVNASAYVAIKGTNFPNEQVNPLSGGASPSTNDLGIYMQVFDTAYITGTQSQTGAMNLPSNAASALNYIYVEVYNPGGLVTGTIHIATGGALNP